MTSTDTRSCEAIEAVFYYGPRLCGVVAVAKVEVEDPQFGDVREFALCAEHNDRYGANAADQHMTLTEFLLARIAEDEAFGTHDRYLAQRWDAECEAKRRIANLHEGWHVCPAVQVRSRSLCMTLQLLALPYTDHPDYRDEWRP